MHEQEVCPLVSDFIPGNASSFSLFAKLNVEDIPHLFVSQEDFRHVRSAGRLPRIASHVSDRRQEVFVTLSAEYKMISGQTAN